MNVNSKIIALIALTAAMLADALSTFAALELVTGAIEGNPIMREVINVFGYVGFFSSKLLIVVLAALLMQVNDAQFVKGVVIGTWLAAIITIIAATHNLIGVIRFT
jgi:hypothetical protein